MELDESPLELGLFFFNSTALPEDHCHPIQVSLDGVLHGLVPGAVDPGDPGLDHAPPGDAEVDHGGDGVGGEVPGEVVADLGGLHLELDALVVLEGLADDDDPGQSRAHLLLKVAAGRGVDQLAKAEGEDGVVDGDQAGQIHPVTERRERLQDLPQRDRPLHSLELDVVLVHLEHPLEVRR